MDGLRFAFKKNGNCYNPEDSRLEPENTPLEEGKKTSSKPNHHFQKIIVNLQGCTMDTCVTYLSHLITIVVSHLLVDLHST